MKNYVQSGSVITLTAPYDVVSGSGLKVGPFVGLATHSALAGDPVETKLDDVSDVTKTPGQAWTAGISIYWDDAAKSFTTSSASNTKVGAAIKDAASADVIGRVRLNGTF